MMDPIELEICWQHLIATVNEQAKALQRSAFSPIVREAGDLANAVFDRRGRMVAQAVTGTPGHINSLAMAVVNILEQYPVDELEPGDVLITNDPYKTAGQLLDVTVLVPVWRNGRLIALFGSTIHHTDVGGYGIGAGGRDVFEEGLWIPIVKLMRLGERNDDVWRFILSNVRQPDHMAGDLHAQMASGEIGAQRLNALCDRHGLDDIEALADEIIERSETATRAGIRELPAGTHHASALLDLADGSEIEIRCALTVDPEAGRIVVDYTGSADASPWGINVVRNYTHAYTTFTVRSVLSPDIPNNHGSLAPIEVVAPEGSIVNAVSPQPCTALATSSGCSCPTRCSRRWPRSSPSSRWPRAPAPCGRCRSTAPTTTADRSSRRCSRTPVASAPEPASPDSTPAPTRRASPRFRSRSSRRRPRSVSRPRRCGQAPAGLGDRPAGWARPSSSPSTPAGRGS